MLLQTDRHNRRQFLQRSAWGFGSAFLLPSLLASCTDHRITPVDPTTPIILPPYTDVQIDWNDAAKKAVVVGLEAIPEVGEILGPLVDIFWPKSKESVWDQVRGEVEALIDQKISDQVYQTVADTLGYWSDAGTATGLIGTITLFQNARYAWTVDSVEHILNPASPAPDSTALLAQFTATKTQFIAAQSHFQEKGYELLLLPLFAQFANLYLALLRIAALFGKDWGRGDEEHKQDILDLQVAIQGYTNYVHTIYTTAVEAKLSTPRNDLNSEPFRTINGFVRGMTLTVLDYRDTWPYYDVSTYPNGAVNSDGTPINMLTREIYSDPFGSVQYSTNKNPIALQSATQLPTNLTVWGYEQIDAVQLTYPDGGGPGGITQTPRMGDQPDGKGSGGVNQPPHGAILNLTPNNPITQVRAIYAIYRYADNYVVTSMQFRFYDGTLTSLMGGTVPNSTVPNDSGLFGYDDEALSSVYIHGENQNVVGADCMVFGFKRWQSPVSTLLAIREIYVKSPNELSIANLTNAFPKRTIPAGLINDELKAARKAHWAWIKAHAHK